MRILLVVLALAISSATTSNAQVQRLLPPNARLGHVFGQQHPYPLVQINQEVLRLAPGGVILDQNNRFILHGALPAHAEVLFVVDSRGEISRIVILTPAELMRLEQTGIR
jgi:hypothetical protein